jgi:polyisoprenoid-binding protein YceI
VSITPPRAVSTLVMALVWPLLAVPATEATAEPQRFRIDPEHFSIAFRGTHIGYADAIGLFLEGGGSFLFDEEARELDELEVTIMAASVFTNHEARDQHLRSGEFLDAERHPEIRFVMTDAEPTGERTGEVTGDLTLRGVTRPVTLDVTWNKSGTYPYNDNYVIGISATTVLRRSEWGMTYAVENGWVADEIPIEIELEAIRE